jgi:hypothetical protein
MWTFLTKNEAKDALIQALRTFIKGVFKLQSSGVLDADKENMSLPLHDGIRTPIPAPTTIVELRRG